MSKKKMTGMIAFLVALMLYSSTAHGASSPLLYKVSNERGNYIYLLGTFHVGNKDMYPFGEPIKNAYSDAEILAVELDLKAVYADPEQLLLLSSTTMYDDGDSAKNHMSPETYQLVLDALGLPEAQIRHLRPYALLSLLEERSLARLGYSTAYGVDQMLINHAYQDGKVVLPLENVDIQVNALLSMSDPLVEYMLRQYAEFPEASDFSLKLLSTAWRQGNEEILSLLLSSEGLTVPKELQAEYVAYSKTLYTDRDAAFTEKAIEFLENGDKVLIAIGAAHIVCEGAMVDRLTAAGYTVEEIGR